VINSDVFVLLIVDSKDDDELVMDRQDESEVSPACEPRNVPIKIT